MRFEFSREPLTLGEWIDWQKVTQSNDYEALFRLLRSRITPRHTDQELLVLSSDALTIAIRDMCKALEDGYNGKTLIERHRLQ